MTDRLAALLDGIDAGTLDNIDPGTAVAVLGACRRMIGKRLNGKADAQRIEDAENTAGTLALVFIAQGMGQTEACAVAAYRAAIRAMELEGFTTEAAAGAMSTDEEVAALVRLALPQQNQPDRAAAYTSPDRLIDASRKLDAPTLDVLNAGMHVDEWIRPRGFCTDGNRHAVICAHPHHAPRPKTSALLAALGMNNNGKNRAKVSAAWVEAVEDLDEAYTAVLHQHSSATEARGYLGTAWGATKDHARKTGAPSPRLKRTERAKAHAHGITGDALAAHLAAVRQGDRAAKTSRRVGTDQQNAAGYTPSSPATASPVVVRYADTHPAAGTWLDATKDPEGGRLYGPRHLRRITQAQAEYVLSRRADLDPRKGSAEERRGDEFAAMQEPLGAVNKPSSIKRRREGSVGSPTIPTNYRRTFPV